MRGVCSWPFKENITSKICGYLPVWNRNILRSVNKDWFRWIKYEKIEFCDYKLLTKILKDEKDNYQYVKFYLEKGHFDITKDNGGYDKEDIYTCFLETKALKSLDVFIKHLKLDINYLYLLKWVPYNNSNGWLPFLEYLYPVMIQSSKTRILSFIVVHKATNFIENLDCNHKPLLNWIIENVISEQSINDFENDNISGIWDKIRTIDKSYYGWIASLMSYYELSNKFKHYLLENIRKKGMVIEIVNIILLLEVVDPTFCEFLDRENLQKLHESIYHICKCNEKTTLKKRKINK